MSKHASELVRGMGAAAHLIQYFADHLPDEELYYLATEAGKETLERMFKVARDEQETTRKNYYEIVIEPQTTEELAKQGKYDFINPEFYKITPKSFEGEESKKEIVYLFEKLFKENNSALTQLHESGYEPVSVEELLHFGVQHPRVQMSKLPIIALGKAKSEKQPKMIDLDALAPSLSRGVSGRRLGVVYPREWPSCWVLCRKIN